MKKILLVCLLIAITACGFHLRGYGGNIKLLPYQSWQIVNGQSMQEALSTELKRQPDVVLESGENAAKLEVLDVVTQRDIQSINRVGSINEYLLILRVTVQVSYHNEAIGQPITVVAQRHYKYSDDDVLGKQEEEEEIWMDLRADIANQIIRRIAALSNQKNPAINSKLQ